MKRFPDLPAYTGFNAPSRMEVDINDLEVEGTLPAELNGAFYRANPDPQFPPRLGTDIYFNGDGMITQFMFKDGRVSLKSRYARTEKFLLEREAGEALFGAYRNPFTDDPRVAGRSRSTANTNAFFHAGKILAMKEDSHPTVMDPITLETIHSSYDYEGKLTAQAFTSHPKVDPKTGGMVAFSYGAKGIDTPDVAYYEIDKNGKITHEAWFQVPYANLMHDFGVTQDYVVFPIVPVCSSIQRAKEGKPVFMWDASKDVFLGVMPRYGKGSEIRWFKAPNTFCSHVMNAFSEGTRIYFDVPEAQGNMFPFFPDVSGAPFDPMKAAARMTRWTLDFDKPEAGFTRQRFGTQVGEFPCIDPRYATLPYRHGWLCVTDRSLPFDSATGGSITGLFINVLGHVDVTIGKEKAYFVGPTSSLQEPCFVPKSATAPEGEGYILIVANRYAEKRSDLLVLDAQHIDEGPIATIRLPLWLRNGLHGNWVPAAQLA